MKSFKFQLLFLLFVFSFFAGSPQTKIIDSLKEKINTASATDDKLKAIFAFCKEKQALPTDTLYRYALMAKAISIERNNTHDVILCDYYLINYLVKMGLDDSCMAICNRYISQLSKSNKDKDLYFEFLAFKGSFFVRSTKYKEALATYYKMLSDAESLQDTLYMGGAQVGIGWVYMEMNQNSEALNSFYKSLETTGNNVSKYGKYYSVLYSNMASVYNNLHKNDSAEFYINKAIFLARKNGNLRYLANSLAIEADIFGDLKKEKAAESALLQAIDIRKQIGDPYYIISDITTLASYYNNTGQPQKGIAVCKEGINMANKYGLSSKLLILFDALASNYRSQGDLVKYGETLKQIISLKDSMYQKNSPEALAEIQTKYNVQKQQNIIIQQKLDLIKKNYFIYGSFILIVLIVIISYLIFRDSRRRQKMNVEKMLSDEKNLSRLAVSSAEEKERHRIAEDLHDNMGAYATAISANVDEMLYQKENVNIALLQSLKTNVSEIMTNLRDTIWALNREDISTTGISDRFKAYLQKMNMTFSKTAFEYNENIITDKMLPSVHALHIFRIMQEACNNALKHANAKKIKINFSCNEKINIIIEDDGQGFNLREEKEPGNGIINMNKRAKEAGLIFSIKNKETGGTEVSISS